MIWIISTRRPEFCTLKLVALNNINLLGLKVTYVWASSRLRKIASLTFRGFCVFQSAYQNVSPPHQILNTRVPEGPWKVFNLVESRAGPNSIFLRFESNQYRIFEASEGGAEHILLSNKKAGISVHLSICLHFYYVENHASIDFTHGGCCCGHKGVQFCILVQYGHATRSE